MNASSESGLCAIRISISAFPIKEKLNISCHFG
jgi:hypothetical protein